MLLRDVLFVRRGSMNFSNHAGRIIYRHFQRCMKGLELFVLFLLVSGAGMAICGEMKNTRFVRLTLEDGLSQASVRAILQDRQGFMWFGTEEGLNRYDGHQFKIYLHDSEKTNSISHDWIWSLFEDQEGNLWVGTEGGLSLYRPQTDDFQQFLKGTMLPDGLENKRVRVVRGDKAGRLWLGTEGGGLSRFDPKTGAFSRVTGPLGPPTDSRIMCIYPDGDDLWIGTGNQGLFRLDQSRNEFSWYSVRPESPAKLSSNRIRSVSKDDEGNLWIGAFDAGVCRLNPISDEIQYFNHDPKDHNSLPSDLIRAIFQDDKGALWIGSNRGLAQWDGETGVFFNHRHDPTQPFSLSHNYIMSIYQDRGGVLWVGSRAGLNKWNTATDSFSHYFHRPDAPESLNHNTVNAFEEDKEGNIWVGAAAGLNLLDTEKGSFVHYVADPTKPGSLSDNRIMSLLVDRDGVLWVGSFGSGIDRLNRNTGVFENFRHNPEDESSLSGNGVTTIRQDGKGVVWAGVYQGGINRQRPGEKGFTRFRHMPGKPTSLSNNRVIAAYIDSSDTLWVGTEGGGLNRFDRDTETFSVYRADPENPQGLSSDTPWALLEAADGVFWIGTQSGGLNRWEVADRDARRPVFRRYGRNDGLPSNVIYAIQEDASGRLWFTTNSGLTRFNPKKDAFKNFDVTHGLQSNDFGFASGFKAKNGRMFFGGSRGFNSFFPEEVKENPNVPQVVLTNFTKLSRERTESLSVNQIKRLDLTRQDYMVVFEFAALDYAAPEKNRYQYKLDNFDEDWVDHGARRQATFTNLEPGDYVFRVKASNNDGNWNEDGLAIPITIHAPPWKTPLAYTAYFLFVILVFLAYNRFHAARLARAAEGKLHLEELVAERTRELDRKNHKLEALNTKLQETSLTDALTGLWNRRFLETRIQEDIAAVDRRYAACEAGFPDHADLLCFLVEIDQLHEIHDVYGHAAGDRILVQISEIFQRIARKTDSVIHMDGDEFMVQCRHSSREAGPYLAERIRSAIENHSFDLGSDHPEITCTIGLCAYPLSPYKPDMFTWDQVVALADQAQTLAKKAGRNGWASLGIGDTEKAHELAAQLNQRPENLVRKGLLTFQGSFTLPG